MNVYVIIATVRDSRIDVDPSLDGKRVRVIILEPETGSPEQTALSPSRLPSRFGTVGIPGVRIGFLSRDDAHAR